MHGILVKTYPIALGASPVGSKTQEGDKKTPEGRYILDWRNPKSAFYKSIHISYPNQQDRTQAKKRNVKAGSDIFIHGLGAKWVFIGKHHTLRDWTLGCIAVINEEMDEIWDRIPHGIGIEINP